MRPKVWADIVLRRERYRQTILAPAILVLVGACGVGVFYAYDRRTTFDQTMRTRELDLEMARARIETTTVRGASPATIAELLALTRPEADGGLPGADHGTRIVAIPQARHYATLQVNNVGTQGARTPYEVTSGSETPARGTFFVRAPGASPTREYKLVHNFPNIGMCQEFGRLIGTNESVCGPMREDPPDSISGLACGGACDAATGCAMPGCECVLGRCR